jgi:hypothetical protein
MFAIIQFVVCCMAMKRRCGPVISLVIFNLLVPLSIAFGSHRAPVAHFRLSVEASAPVAADWALLGATVEEDSLNTYVYLHLQNVSDDTVHHALLYAELFDGEGRFCFSALFDLARNRQGQAGPLKRGGVRTLYSVSAGLQPSAVPRIIRLYPMNPSHGDSLGKGSAPVAKRIPVTLQATGVPVLPDWQTFWIGSASDERETPVLDLALAQIDVDRAGKVTNVWTVQALNDAVVAWTERAIGHLVFRPSSMDLRTQKGRTLIMVRALMHPWKERDPRSNATETAWVRDYSNGLGEGPSPVVNILVLHPCLGEGGSSHPDKKGGKLLTAPSCLEYTSTGSEWSVGIWKPQTASYLSR